jgi:hypothetical protein
LRADDLSPGAVSQWNDASGKGNHLTQSSGADQPTAVANQLNGLPVVHFDGVSEFLQGPSVISGTVGRTVMLVAKNEVNDPAADVTLIQLNAGGSEGNGKYWALTPEVALRVNGNKIFDQALPLNEFHILAALSAASSQTAASEAYIDGVALGQASVVDAPLDTGTNGTQVGMSDYQQQFVESHFQGDIAELLVFDRALNSTERGTVRAYLNGRWGI